MSANIDYEVPTWNQIYDMLLCQAQKIRSQNYHPDIIVAIARGGTVPARILTDLLETPELSFIQIEFYTDIQKTQTEPTLKQTLTTKIQGQKNVAGRRHRRHRRKPKTRQNPPPNPRRPRNQNRHPLPQTPINHNPRLLRKTNNQMGSLPLGHQRDPAENNPKTTGKTGSKPRSRKTCKSRLTQTTSRETSKRHAVRNPRCFST